MATDSPAPGPRPRLPSLSDEQRAANDRHRHWVPLLVLSFLLALTYLWTPLMADHPPPGIAAWDDHRILGQALTSDGHLRTSGWIFRTSPVTREAQRRLLIGLVALGFLCVYYLPLRLKRPPLVLLTAVGLASVVGTGGLVLFLAWHLFAFATFHRPDPRRGGAWAGSAFLALAGSWSFAGSRAAPLEILIATAVAWPLLHLAYAAVWRHLAAERRWLRGCVAHASLFYIGIQFTGHGFLGDDPLPRPIGWLLFFWQWERLVMYRIDLEDGRVPHDLPLLQYLAVFLTPAAIANFNWLSRIPLGYRAVNGSFLVRDKNRVMLSGLWLLTLSVLFFALRPVVLELFDIGMQTLGLPEATGYRRTLALLERGPVHVAAVWCGLFRPFLSFALLWAAVAHMKVGLWRLLGHDIERYFQRPFLSTNLVELWKRYSFHYREFLVQAFYYPVFLRYLRRRPRLRVFVATLAAAGLGNFLYHVLYAALQYEASPEVFFARMRTIPYYLLLGAGIAGTQVFLVARGRRRRRPWSGGWKIGLDVLGVVATFAFFVWIRPFHHLPKRDTIGETLRLLLAALGIQG